LCPHARWRDPRSESLSDRCPRKSTIVGNGPPNRSRVAANSAANRIAETATILEWALCESARRPEQAESGCREPLSPQQNAEQHKDERERHSSKDPTDQPNGRPPARPRVSKNSRFVFEVERPPKTWSEVIPLCSAASRAPECMNASPIPKSHAEKQMSPPPTDRENRR
jgi:hypothetical protein